jgi:hypothetical protein
VLCVNFQETSGTKYTGGLLRKEKAGNKMMLPAV